MDEFKKDTSKAHLKGTDEKGLDKKINKEAEEKSKKPLRNFETNQRLLIQRTVLNFIY